MAKQLTWEDLRDANADPVFAQPGLVRSLPQSTREIVDQLGGSQHSGHQRAVQQSELLTSLRLVYRTAKRLHGEREAAALLLRICARDESFVAPYWLVALWRRHETSLLEQFVGTGDDGHTDYAHRDEDSDAAGNSKNEGEP